MLSAFALRLSVGIRLGTSALSPYRFLKRFKPIKKRKISPHLADYLWEVLTFKKNGIEVPLSHDKGFTFRIY
jgi:hypothetical protein